MQDKIGEKVGPEVLLHLDLGSNTRWFFERCSVQFLFLLSFLVPLTRANMTFACHFIILPAKYVASCSPCTSSLKQSYSLLFIKVASKNVTHVYMHVSTGVQSLQTEKVAAFGESLARSCPCGSPDSGQFEQDAGLSAIFLTLHQIARQKEIFPPPGRFCCPRRD